MDANFFDNSNLRGINGNFADQIAWNPRLKYVWNNAAKTLTITDETVDQPAQANKNVNIQVHDQYGNTAYGNMSSGGAGYTVAPTVNIAAPPAGGTQATATAVLERGRVVGINITNPGSGYAAAPLVTITPVGADAPTKTATGLARTVNGTVATISLSNSSSGAIDISKLSVNKGLNVTADYTIDTGLTATGSAFHITPDAAGGYLQDWNRNAAPASVRPR